MLGIDLVIKLLLGPYVDRKAQMIETAKICRKAVVGKKDFSGSPRKRPCCKATIQPRKTPIIMPRRALDMIKIKAS